MQGHLYGAKGEKESIGCRLFTIPILSVVLCGNHKQHSMGMYSTVCTDQYTSAYCFYGQHQSGSPCSESYTG